MTQKVMENFRIQSDDLRDELQELERWEDQMNQASSLKQKGGKVNERTTTGGASSTLLQESYFSGAPPIRGTVSSLKEAVQKEREEKRKTTQLDPVVVAKEKGNDYFRLNQLSEAIDAYSEGINYEPNGKSTYILYANRAMCYLRQELWSKAQNDANICVAMNSTYAKGYYRRALASKNLGNLKEARRDLEAVLALSPNDAAGRSELEIVTKMIQMERAKEEGQGLSATGVKKKIVIQEVDDDEEDEEEPEETKEGESKVVDTEKYKQDVLTHQNEVERREREAEEIRRRKIAEEKNARVLHSKASDRVEVVEIVELDKVPQTHAPSPPVGGKEGNTSQGRSEHSGHFSSACPPSTSQAPPSRVLPSAKASKESLSVPKSYSEFERVFASLEKDEEVRNYYITLLDPRQTRQLFGSNMSPEILCGILKSIISLPPSQALEWLQGLSRVNRIGDITLFFSEKEQCVVREVYKYVEKVATPNVLASIKEKLMPF